MSAITVNTLPATATTLDSDSMEAVLRAVEPAAVLLPPWLLQNIITVDRDLGSSPFTVPHRKIHIIGRDHLLRIARTEHLPIPDDLPAAETLFLLARGEAEWFAALPVEQALRHYWRLLFHARVDVLVRNAIAESTCRADALAERIDRLGRGIFYEARFVLFRERYLHSNADDREVYAEFAAVFLEFHHFRPELLPVYFPSITNPDGVYAQFVADVSAEEVLRQTRPAGAADHFAGAAHEAAHTIEHEEISHLREHVVEDAHRRPELLARADRAATLGNSVRAAILRKRVFHAQSHDHEIYNAAMRDLDHLVDRLGVALELDADAKHGWRAALSVLLAHAAGGWWNPEDRLLYDLQKICVYHEREIYSIGVVEWLLEFCRRPLRRPQPRQRVILMVKSLRTALRRLPSARLTAPQRAKLTQLIHNAEHHLEERLREELHPVIESSLQTAGVHPADPAEQIAKDKLTEELIDGLEHRGFLTMSLVRDSISRNQIKLPDIPGVAAFVRGDPLLRIDRALSDSLDGVYHRGEMYLRFFQRLSSLLFATVIGRFITKTLLMPIGGAYLLIEAIDHTLFLILRLITGWHWLELGHLNEKHVSRAKWFHDNPEFIILSFVLLGVLNWPAFRTIVGQGLHWFGRALRGVFIDAPMWFTERPWVQAIVESRVMTFTIRYIAKPLIFAGLALLFVPKHVSTHTRYWVLGTVFIVVNFLLNSRLGRTVEQMVLQWLRLIATRITSDLIANAFRRLMHFFERRLEDVERMLYAVDEWLRFRAGQSGASLVLKAALGVFWFYVAYVIRFAVNLLIEPQINPIKHFPVVTVSHKIILPHVVQVANALEGIGIRKARAGTLAATIVTGIPGIFGFIAWELRANWMLYRANRPKVLKPIAIGSHGESMIRLLRPGFHSGTVPKIFQHLRHARRHFDDLGRSGRHAQSSAHKQVEAAEHVREAVGRFIEREFIALLDQHPAWQESPILLGEVRLCTKRIAIELRCPALAAASAMISVEQRHGWILAGIEAPGWMNQMSPVQSDLLAAALLGFYKMCGVDIVAEQIKSLFPGNKISFDVTRAGLIIWLNEKPDAPIQFDLAKNLPPNSSFNRLQLLLSENAVTWDQWVRIWKSPELPPTGLPAVKVLPILIAAAPSVPIQ